MQKYINYTKNCFKLASDFNFHVICINVSVMQTRSQCAFCTGVTIHDAISGRHNLLSVSSNFSPVSTKNTLIYFYNSNTYWELVIDKCQVWANEVRTDWMRSSIVVRRGRQRTCSWFKLWINLKFVKYINARIRLIRALKLTRVYLVFMPQFTSTHTD